MVTQEGSTVYVNGHYRRFVEIDFYIAYILCGDIPLSEVTLALTLFVKEWMSDISERDKLLQSKQRDTSDGFWNDVSDTLPPVRSSANCKVLACTVCTKNN